MAEPRQVLVTGGAGFIGSHLVPVLISRGDHVVVIDDLSTGRLSNLDGIPDAQLQFIEATVHDQVGGGSLPVFDEIYHLAAAVGVKLIVESPVQCIENNVHETSLLLRAAAEWACPILIASTSEVYGKSERLPFCEDDDVTYGPTTESRWSYACSKAIDEHLALGWYASSGLPVVIARFFNTVGPQQRGRWGMVLPRFVAAALRGEPLHVHGDGTQERCFVDVRDVAPVLPRLLGNTSAHGRVVNVGHDESVSISDLATRVIEVLNSSSDIKLVTMADDYGRDIEDLQARVPDLRRLRSLCEFHATFDLDQTILDTAAAMRADKSGP
jgi:UDP-glucose 4-epimerase